jgi:hypothetical protein
MKTLDIAHRRLLHQHLSLPTLTEPGDVVAWLGAVQAQDFSGAKWAVGLRMRNATDRDVERAFSDGVILRTHLLRPTWHFVTPGDIRWILALTAPRVHAANAYMYRKLQLDNRVFKRSHAALRKALQGGNHLTRNELRLPLRKAGIETDAALRMGYVLMQAELEGVICSGARRGKQFTYALFEERVPYAKTLARDEALAELARRYFLSRGPATVHDFAKWAGLTLADARVGLEASSAELQHDVVNEQTYWSQASRRSTSRVPFAAHLLSIYDEYVSGYKDHLAIVDKETGARLRALGNALTNIVVVDGRIVGTWKRTLKTDAVVIQANTFSRPTIAANKAITLAAHQYGAFLGLPARLVG